MHGSHSRRGGAILLAGLTAAGLWGAQAAAAATTVRVASPPDGGIAFQRKAAPLRVELRVAAAARVRAVRVNGRTVPSASVARGGRTRRLVVARKRLRRGRNVILVRADPAGGTPAHTYSRFTLARPHGGLARNAQVRRHRGMLRLGLRAAHGVEVRLNVNGKGASADLREIADGVRRADLAPHSGLRRGRNVISVRAIDRAHGRYQDVRRVVRLRHSRSLADAGRDRRVRVGATIHLDARRTQHGPGASAAATTTRWKVVDAPEGSKAEPDDATSLQPLIAPDVPGTYTLSATAGTGAATTTDTIVIHARPGAPWQPAAVTISGEGRTGIELGTTFEPANFAGPGVQMVAVERDTLGFIFSQTYSPDAMSALASDVATLKANYADQALIAVTGLAGGAPVATDGVAAFQGAMAQIGAAAFTPTGQFGVVGNPYLDQGNATVEANGPLTGALVVDQNGMFHFVFNDSAAFDTHADAPAGVANRVAVGDVDYDIPSTETGGFQVVTLDRDTLAGTSQFFQTAGSGWPTAMAGMADALVAARGDGDVVIVSNVGTPLTATSADVAGPWSVVVTLLSVLGASPGTLAQFGQPADTYSFVGPAAPGGQVAEASNLITAGGVEVGGGAARITGLLTRDGVSDYRVGLSAYGGEPDFGLPAIAFAPTGPWPLMDAPGTRAAYHYISAQLDPACTGSRCSVRTGYQDSVDDDYWTEQLVLLRGLKFPGSSGGFTLADFSSVQAQLEQEFEYVPLVFALTDALAAPLTDESTSNYTDIVGIAAQIQGALTVPAASSGEAQSIVSGLSDVLWIASSVLGPEFDVAAAALGVAAGAADLGSAFLTDADGNPIGDAVAVTGAEAAGAWATNAVAAAGQIKNLAPLIVSDWGKLSTVAPEAAPGGAWAFTDAQLDELGTALAQGTTQTAWQALFPVAYKAWWLRPTNTNPKPSIATYKCYDEQGSVPFPFTPFVGLPASAQTTLFVPPIPLLRLYALRAAGNSVNSSSQLLPPASITDPLFESTDANGVGFYPTWFWERYLLPGAQSTPSNC